MKIINSSDLKRKNPTALMVAEVKEQKKGIKADSFRLNITGRPAQVTSDEIQRMLSAARRSTDYQKNFHKYQFKLVNKSGHQVLTLKEQGLFSKLKGKLGIKQTERETQRAAAANLIHQTFMTQKLSLGTTVNSLTGVMSHDDAIQFQRDLMTSSDLAPQAKKLLTSQEKKDAGIPKTTKAAPKDSPVTMQQLMAEELPAMDMPSRGAQRGSLETGSQDNKASYTSYHQEDERLLQPSGSLASSSEDLNPWLKPQAPRADAWRVDDQPASFNDNYLINPRPFAGLRSSDVVISDDRSSIDSMNSASSKENMMRHFLANH